MRRQYSKALVLPKNAVEDHGFVTDHAKHMLLDLEESVSGRLVRWEIALDYVVRDEDGDWLQVPEEEAENCCLFLRATFDVGVGIPGPS